MRASAFCAHAQSQGQTEPVIIHLMKQKPVKKNYDHDTSGDGTHFHTHSSNNGLSPLHFCNLLHSHSFHLLMENILENPTQELRKAVLFRGIILSFTITGKWSHPKRFIIEATVSVFLQSQSFHYYNPTA